MSGGLYHQSGLMREPWPEGTAPARAGEVIEIGLAGGYRVRVSEGVQAATRRLVLEVLERR